MIRIILFVLLAFFACVGAFEQKALAGSERIAAVVNEDAITITDVNDRLRLVIASAGLPNSNEIREKLKPQVMGALIEESLIVALVCFVLSFMGTPWGLGCGTARGLPPAP